MTPEQKQKRAASQKRYWDKNRDKLAEKKRRHYHKYRDKYLEIERNRAYQKLYGITTVEYDVMLLKHSGVCAICKTTESTKGGKRQYFAVDHCHTTGKVRGLLCLACNHLLGRYEKHRNAIHNYLKDITV